MTSRAGPGRGGGEITRKQELGGRLCGLGLGLALGGGATQGLVLDVWIEDWKQSGDSAGTACGVFPPPAF